MGAPNPRWYHLAARPAPLGLRLEATRRFRFHALAIASDAIALHNRRHFKAALKTVAGLPQCRRESAGARRHTERLCEVEPSSTTIGISLHNALPGCRLTAVLRGILAWNSSRSRTAPLRSWAT